MKKTLLFLLIAITVYGQDLKPLSMAERIYGLSRFWQEVNYNFAYLDRVGRDKWDKAYYDAIPAVLNAENDYKYYRELQKFCAILKDGHTNIYIPFEESNSNFGEYRIYFGNFDNKPFVVGINKSKKEEIPLGTEVLEVNGMQVEEYIMKYVAPFISSSTEYVLRDLAIQRLLRGIEGEKYEVKFRTPKGRIFNLSLVHSKTTEKELHPEIKKSEIFEFKWIDRKIAYVALNSFSNPKIDTLFLTVLSELYKAGGVIIDLRNNGGGSSHVGDFIFKYLTNDSLILKRRGSTRQHIAAYKAYGGLYQPKDTLTGDPARGRSKEEVKKYLLAGQDKLFYEFEYVPEKNDLNVKKITVPIVLLIGHSTASAAEDFVVSTLNQRHITKVGENTFGSTGQPYSFGLPGKGSARVCTIRSALPNYEEFVGVGIKPDVVAVQKIEDYIKQYDSVLDKGVEILKEKIALK